VKRFEGEELMKGHNDEWLKDRILWAARKNGLPTGITSVYEDSTSLPLSLRNAANSAGVPVLTIVDRDTRWIVLGTDKIIVNDDGDIREIVLDDIREIRWPIETGVPVKNQCDFIVIRDNVGSEYNLWLPSGTEFYAIFNTLLRLINLRASASE
jgi:hypothetical protein